MSDFIQTPTWTFVHDIGELDAANGRLFGGKATGLARMAAAGIPVPPAFVISTDAFRAFYANGRRLPDAMRAEVDAAMLRLGQQLGRRFGGDGRTCDPLLVSVRSGAQVSMPGMMDTILNLGLDARSAAGFIAVKGRRHFVIDTWLRFWKMYADIVLGLDGEMLLEAVAPARAAAEAEGGDLDALEAAIVAHITDQGEEAPTDPRVQLDRAIAAVFASWESPRARAYREHQKIPHDLGTAVTVQAMVFGNADGESGSGVAFSRNPNTGDPVLYGEYLAGCQGEDIVSGARTPVDLSSDDASHAALRKALEGHARTLEALYGDAVDIEFTLEAGKLYLLQVRTAKRTAAAAVHIAADLIAEDRLDPAAAVKLVSAEQVKRLLRPVFAEDQLAEAVTIATGIGSSPGQVSGVAVLDSDRAAERAAAGEKVILVRPTTSPLDIRGMLAAGGILTIKGGALSHAAVVSRALDKPCVVGCEALDIDVEARRFSVSGRVWHEGDPLAIDGSTGAVYDRAIDLVTPAGSSDSLSRLLHHADSLSQAAVWSTGLQDAEAPGVAVVSFADVAIAQGLIDPLIAAVIALGQGEDPEGAALSNVAHEVGMAIATAAPALPVHVRLPQAGSSRARLLIPQLPELDQRLFLPFGHPAYVRALLSGLSRASQARGAAITALLGGVTGPAEGARLKNETDLSTGVVIQNVAGLEAAPAMLAAGYPIWVDLDEVIHSAHGFVSKAYVSGAVLDDYFAQVLLAANPRKVLKPFLAALFEQLAGAPGAAERAGIVCASDIDPALVRTLHAQSFRRFSAPPEQRAMLRLLLGQAAAEKL